MKLSLPIPGRKNQQNTRLPQPPTLMMEHEDIQVNRSPINALTAESSSPLFGGPNAKRAAHRRRLSCGIERESSSDPAKNFKSGSTKDFTNSHGKFLNFAGFHDKGNTGSNAALLPANLLMGRLNDRPKTNQFRKPISRLHVK